MKYRLVSRFEGAIWGAVLGETLGAIAPGSRRVRSHTLLYLAPDLRGASAPLPLNANLQENARRLLNLGDWVPSQNQPPADLENPAALVLATLPLTLFCYDQADQLQRHLSQTAIQWQVPPHAQGGWHKLSHAIALLLKEQLPDQSFVEALKAENSQPAWLALHYFLQTPTDLEIALRRAATSEAPPLLCPLIGVLAGAWNSLAGIPLSWAMGLQASSSESAALQSEIRTLAEQLFCAWAGVAKGGQDDVTLAVTAPNGIRPR